MKNINRNSAMGLFLLFVLITPFIVGALMLMIIDSKTYMPLSIVLMVLSVLIFGGYIVFDVVRSSSKKKQ